MGFQGDSRPVVKVSVVAVTFTHEDDTDPVEAIDDILSYAMNRGLYAEELGLSASKRLITTNIDEIVVDETDDNYRIPNWDSIAV